MANKKVNLSGINTSGLTVLTAKESEELLRRIKNGEKHLRDTFIEGNMRLVLSLVQRFHTEKVSADDLFQVGVMGLMKALDNFDVRYNVMFSTYAVPMILGEMKRFIRESCTLKVGRSVRDIAYRAMQAREKLEKDRTGEADLEEIASEIDVPYTEVVGALDAISDPVSLYEPVYNDGEESMLVLDQIRDPKTDDDMLTSMTLRDEISKLPDKEKAILTLRYYIGKTQTEISKELGMSQAQISRLEKTAISRLKEAF